MIERWNEGRSQGLVPTLLVFRLLLSLMWIVFPSSRCHQLYTCIIFYILIYIWIRADRVGLLGEVAILFSDPAFKGKTPHWGRSLRPEYRSVRVWRESSPSDKLKRGKVAPLTGTANPDLMTPA